MLLYTQLIKTNEISNEWINNRSYHFIHNCLTVMIKHHQWENLCIFFLQQIFDRFWCFVLKCGWKNLYNPFSLCPMCFQNWMCNISKLKLKYTRLFFLIVDIFFDICLNGKQSRFSNINFLNGRYFWKSHFGDDRVSSIWLFFISYMIFSNIGMNPKTNLITFEQKWMFCSDKSVVLSKGANLPL